MTPEAQLALVNSLPAIIAALAALVAAIVGVQNHGKINNVSTKIDGRMDEILTLARSDANAAGRVEGTAIERDRVAGEKPELILPPE